MTTPNPTWRYANKVKPDWWVRAEGEWFKVRMVMSGGPLVVFYGDSGPIANARKYDEVATLTAREAKSAGLS
jgi:hypothetical protein